MRLISDCRALEQQYDILLEHAQLEEPQPTRTGSKGRHKRTKGRNLLERLQKFKPAVLAFAAMKRFRLQITKQNGISGQLK